MAAHSAPDSDRTPGRHGRDHLAVTTSGEARPAAIEGLKTLKGVPDAANSVLGGRVSSRTARVTSRAQERAGKTKLKRRTLASKILSAVIGVAVLGGLAATLYYAVLPRLVGSAASDRPSVEKGVETEILIPDGTGAGEIAELLYQEGIIDDRTAFLQAIKRQDAEQLLKSGAYRLITGADPAEVVRQLVEGPNSTVGSFTVPEGLTVAKTADLAESRFGIARDAFLAQAKASNYVDEYPFLADVANDSLEGFLFPKTYDFTGQEVTADLIIRTMLDQYAAEISGIDFEGARSTLQDRYGIEFSDYDIITMASIIERETNTDEDRATVASVLYNRLELDIPLQSDATTEYVVGREVYQSDLAEDNPYNSYLNGGLTPTPICSPGIASINAALDPEQTSYMFFYMDGDYHVFSETIEEHEQAIANAPGD